MKKTAEITRNWLLGPETMQRNARAAVSLLLASLLFWRTPTGALASCGLFAVLAVAGALLVYGSVRNHRTGIQIAVFVLLAAAGTACIFPRRDHLGAIGIGLWILVLGVGAFRNLCLSRQHLYAAILTVSEALLPILLGITFLVNCRGSFPFAAPFYTLTLAILAFQNFRWHKRA